MAATGGNADAERKIGIRVLGHDFFQALVIDLVDTLESHRYKKLTVAARVVMSISISLPSSSFLGFAATTVALVAAEAEKLWRCCTCLLLIG